MWAWNTCGLNDARDMQHAVGDAAGGNNRIMMKYKLPVMCMCVCVCV